ncbi:HEAT repeat domain-containing protein [Candidatus Riflebacteria bacterium]
MATDIETLLFSEKSEEQVEGLQKIVKLKDIIDLKESWIPRINKQVSAKEGAVRFYARKVLNLNKLPIPGEELEVAETQKTQKEKVEKEEEESFNETVVVFSTLNFSKPEKIIKYFKYPTVIKNWDIAFFKGIFKSGKEEYIPHLVNYLKKSKNNIHTSFIVKQIGMYKKPELLDVIKGFVEHKDGRVAANAVEGLELLDDPRVVPIFSDLLQHDNNRVVANAIKALNRYDPEKVKVAIKKMLGSRKDKFILSALFVVGWINNPELIYLLLPLLEREKYKENVFELLQKMDQKDVISQLNQIIPKLKSEKSKKIKEILSKKLDEMENRILEDQIKSEKEERRLKFIDSQRVLDVDKTIEQADEQVSIADYFLTLSIISLMAAGAAFLYTASIAKKLDSDSSYIAVIFLCLGLVFWYLYQKGGKK